MELISQLLKSVTQKSVIKFYDITVITLGLLPDPGK